MNIDLKNVLKFHQKRGKKRLRREMNIEGKETRNGGRNRRDEEKESV
jgi:hypothetical protein